MSQKSSQGMSGTAKALILGGGVIGVVVGGYYVLTNIFNAGVGAYKTLFQQEYSNFITKLDNYNTQNGPNATGLTATQMQAIKIEQDEMNLTLKGLAAAANAPWNTAQWVLISGIIVGVAGAVILSALKLWLSRSGQQSATGYSITYGTLRALADELSQNGYGTQAANLIQSSQEMFQNLSLPAMQQLQQGLQADLANLIGIEYEVAAAEINLLSAEISYIPSLLSEPLLF